MSFLDEAFAGTEVMPDEVGVNDPIWATSGPEITSDVRDPSNMHELGEHSPIRTLSDGLDFLQGVKDDIDHFVEHEIEQAKGHRHPTIMQDECPIPIRQTLAASWRAVTFNIDGSQGPIRIVERRPDRYRVVITNWSNAILYLSADSAALSGPPRINQIQVPPNSSREFKHRDEIWAAPAVSGTGQIVDVQDEYGVYY